MDIFELERRHTSGVYPKRDVAIVRGKGVYVWDSLGREYIDCAGGQGVANLGHCHPAVVEAVTRQAQTLITCPEIFYNDRRAELLERLCRILPQGMERIFLCNSGAEAIEAAIKFARLSTGRPGVVAAMRGFHGRTMGALSATWDRKYRDPFEPLIPGFTHVPFDNLEAVGKAVGDSTAAVLIEIVQGEGGVRPGSPAYFAGLRRLCDERNVLLIVDEVQTGFGRTGRWFAYDHMAITPDLICMGKAIAGGIPMGATAIGPRVIKLPTHSHGSTFGGNPLACAAALAALTAYEKEGLIARSAELGVKLLERLRSLNAPIIREVRGLGLMVGVELKTRVTPILQTLMQKGVLALPAGSNVLRLLPPLVIEEKELGVVMSALEAALSQAVIAQGQEE